MRLLLVALLLIGVGAWRSAKSFKNPGIPSRHPLRDPITLKNYDYNFWEKTASKSSNNVFHSQNGYKWSEEWYKEMPVDHFAYTDNRTFELRYFINTESYKPGGPILFYTGNEGSLESFAENTGFMWDIAPEFNAAVVFAEHRFYGKSKPFGDDSYKATKYLGYLSSQQALADFVVLINHLKDTRIKDAQKSRVIAFGGSYGGMLSAWLRIKYPHVVQGAIAASAPVFWFQNSGIQEDIYDRIVTRSFVGSGCNFKAIEGGWGAIASLAETENGRAYLNDLFHLSSESTVQAKTDATWLIGYIREAMERWPVQETCKKLKTVPDTPEKLAAQMYETLCANPANCAGAFAALGDVQGWTWQTCTEMVMPLCANGPPSDFFWKDCPFSTQQYAKTCTDMFGARGYDRTMMRPDWAIQHYGSYFPTASNIVFSNGFLDPWSGGGWALKPKTEGSLVSLILLEGAHHYDLRGANEKDTDEVKKVREEEKKQIAKWISQPL
ncbi:unnamed protein product, partial [Mesorhabditis spiculigera]